MTRMPDFRAELGPVEGFAHRVEDIFRHHHDAPQPPATCGQCQGGEVEAKGCTCGDGLPPYGHEPGCGWEPCPNGCWDILHPPTTIATDTPEEPMSFVDTLEAKAADFLAEVRKVDRAALDTLERVQANPDTAEAFLLLDQLTHLPVGESVLTTAIAVLRMAVTQPVATQPAFVPAEPAFVPQAAGPVTGGVA